ncbi:MAG: NAD(P)H-quinone oxidoreductase [Spongiibacteraceae bacterium]
MKAIEITQPGAPEVLQLTERPQPQPQAGEVLIRVAAAGINRPDVAQRLGHYPAPAGASDLPGLEVAGEIVGGDLAHADNRLNLKIGDRVCALLQGGGYAEYATAAIALCLPVPKNFSDVEAAALPETFFTVWSNVFQRALLGIDANGRRETLLVQGGSSGIGVTAIQLAKAFGHRVFVTAGNAEKCRACETLGAERAINYHAEDFVDVVRQLTDGRGVDVILDMVAGDYLPREVKALADDGRIAVIALLGGSRTQLSMSEILLRRLTITGATLRPRPLAYKQKIAGQLYEHVWPLLDSAVIKPVIHQVFPASAAAAAHTLMESSTHIGKIILQWQTE